MYSQATICQQLPPHLRQFVKEQDYEKRYTPRDHGVWRYVMRQLAEQLRSRAHPVYFEGIAATGMNVEQIPTMEEMNACLDKIGWRAVVVDGFIPSQAFMEMQALKVLAIAADIRNVEQINYTPAPDIIHEAAGHAPIIADPEYSAYLQRFGEIGMRAMYNQWDLDVYDAIRNLSIVKATSNCVNEIESAEERLQSLLASSAEASELGLLTRLHWWTVEYGLVGEVESAKIFGAGLLSSILESESCLKDTVEKIPLTIDAINSTYDITRQQPRLFVTKSCRHLMQVLEQFAATMCYHTGGADAVQTAVDSGVVTTCVYSSGLQVSGRFDRLLRNAVSSEIYIGTVGPTQLAARGKELCGHGIECHHAGFGSPVGRVCNLLMPLEDASESDLQTIGLRRGKKVELEFLSGITVCGELVGIEKDHGKILLMTFRNCRVSSATGECLFDPSWGDYDMAIGERIDSVYAGSADISRFDVYPKKTDRPVAAKPTSIADQVEFSLFAQVKELRTKGSAEALPGLVKKVLYACPDAWLLQLELLELVTDDRKLESLVRQNLLRVCGAEPALATMISRGLKLVTGVKRGVAGHDKVFKSIPSVNHDPVGESP